MMKSQASRQLVYETVRSRLFRLCDGTGRSEEHAQQYVRMTDPDHEEWWMHRYRDLMAQICSRCCAMEEDARRQVEKLRDKLDIGFDVKLKVDDPILRFWVRDDFNPRSVWRWDEYNV